MSNKGYCYGLIAVDQWEQTTKPPLAQKGPRKRHNMTVTVHGKAACHDSGAATLSTLQKVRMSSKHGIAVTFMLLIVSIAFVYVCV